MAVQRRSLGSTGVDVSAVGLGGFHLSKPSEAEALRIVHAALDAGIDFLDNCWDYALGASEERMGKALAGGRRDGAFVMTKADGRSREAATRQLDESLRRLGTDHVDLWQFHEVIRFEDAEELFALGGIEAALEARAAGKVRFIGFTGHKDPAIHLHMLEIAARHEFAFDTVQMPLNVLDSGYERSFRHHVLPVLEASGTGVLGMKPLASGELLSAGRVDAPSCLRYALSLPTDVVITGCESTRDVEQAARAAQDFTPFSAEEMAELERRFETEAKDGGLERYKTTNVHDGTAAHPEWLGIPG